MPRLKITRTAVEKLPLTPTQIIQWDTKLSGFGVRCNPTSRSWLVAYRINGKEYRKSLGRCDRVDIDIAYRQAEAIIKDAAQGIRPEDREREATQAEAVVTLQQTTLRQIFDSYCGTQKALKQSSKDLYLEELERYCADWLTLPLRDITPDMILAKHAAIGTTAPSRADAVMKVMRALCNHAIAMHDDQLITKNPVTKLNKVGGWYGTRRRESHLSREELPAWLAALRHVRRDPRDILTILLFTGARLREITSLEWSEVDLKAATLHVRDTKTGKPLHVPVCATVAMLLLFRQVECDGQGYVFPARGDCGHLDDLRASLRAIERHGGKLITPHDLRRTFLTICEEIDLSATTKKRLVGHVSDDITDGYIQISMTRMRQAVERVEDYIFQSVNSQQVSK